MGRAMVRVPMTRVPEGSRLTRVPEMVMPGPPAERVVPAIEMADGLTVKVWSPIVKIELELGTFVIPNPPTTIAPRPRLVYVAAAVVLASVSAGDAATSVEVAPLITINREDIPSEIVDAGMVMPGIGFPEIVVAGIVVPDTVIASPPGVRVWPAITNSEYAFADMVEEPIVRTVGEDGEPRTDVMPFITIADPCGAREKVVPDITTGVPAGARV